MKYKNNEIYRKKKRIEQREVMRDELKRLRVENEELKKENSKLKSQIHDHDQDQNLCYTFPYKLIKEMAQAINGVDSKWNDEDCLNDNLNMGYFQTDNLQYQTRNDEIPCFGEDEKGNGYLYFENSEDYEFLDVKTMLGVGFREEGIEPKNPKELERILDLIEEEYKEEK